MVFTAVVKPNIGLFILLILFSWVFFFSPVQMPQGVSTCPSTTVGRRQRASSPSRRISRSATCWNSRVFVSLQYILGFKIGVFFSKVGSVSDTIILKWFTQPVLRIRIRDPNPDPPNPHVFGPPGSGSGSIRQSYGSGSCSGSGSGSFYH